MPQVIALIQNRDIKHQFRNNSGSTMRDAVDTIEKKLNAVDDRHTELERADGKHRQ
ncbi:hypothetical protein [Agromyces indicus]|uniref:Uncharacterized protein n=1 Tax=Agromyces indicus TaxID=758919 RepID=A0ABU1FJC7_9MICO|nr:hypothetical protein [Agromyces indicus]MDR5691870.1 hypothetical protein [Agromyces indicus]